MKKILFVFACFCCSGASELTLDKAQLYLLENNFDIRLAEEDVSGTENEIREAKAAFYPSFDIAGSYSYLTEKSRIHISMPPFINNTIEAGQHDRKELGADLSWPVFTGLSRYYNLRNRENIRNGRELTLNVTQNRYSYVLASMYLRWSLVYQQQEVKKNSIARISKYAEQMRMLKTGGVVVEAKVLEAEAKLKAAELDYILARDQADSLKTELLGLIRIKDSSFVPQTSGFIIDSAAIPDSVMMSRDENMLYDNNMEQIRTMEKIIKSQRYPAVLASGGYRVANPGINTGMDEFMDYFLFGLQVKMNVFDGFKNRSQRAQLQHKIDMMKIDKEKNNDAWSRSLELWKKQIVSADERIRAALVSSNAAQAYMISLENSLSAGVVTDVDYQSAVTGFEQADLQVVQAQYSRRIAILNAIFVSGGEIRF